MGFLDFENLIKFLDKELAPIIQKVLSELFKEEIIFYIKGREEFYRKAQVRIKLSNDTKQGIGKQMRKLEKRGLYIQTSPAKSKTFGLSLHDNRDDQTYKLSLNDLFKNLIVNQEGENSFIITLDPGIPGYQELSEIITLFVNDVNARSIFLTRINNYINSDKFKEQLEEDLLNEIKNLSA